MLIMLLALFLVTMFLGTANSFSMSFASIVNNLTHGASSVMLTAQQCYYSTSNLSLLAVPFFMLAGSIMNMGGISRRLINFCRLFVGRIRGGLAIVAVLAAMIFAAISGSGPATVAALGVFMIPAMVNDGYDVGFAGALMGSAGGLGIIIPPSIPMVIYATLAGCSVGTMFCAGIVPGIILGLAMMIYAYIIARRNGYKPAPVDAPTFKDKAAGFAGGFIMLGLEKLCDKMPKALNGIKPVLIYPLAGLGIIAVVMCAINPFMGMINTGISDFLNNMGSSSKILLGAVLGAMMSIDMGGPFNKAAYVFGTAAIAAGNYDVMAAVMIGGMVPPIAIALSTTFFKNRWTEEERKSGPVNYIMGLSFVTEGAIPYAAADPLRVIPACMVGAGLAGGLSMAFNCTLMAPHGGIFVFAVVGNWAMYLAALAAGSIVGMLLLALLKKKKVSAKKK